MNSEAEAWRGLDAELDRWAAAGETATMWWRDDDAIAPTLELDLMLQLVNRYRVPLGLAVIPATATTALAGRLQSEPFVDVLQHGYIHKNHAGAGERAAEFGAQRPLATRAVELSQGWELLASMPRRTPIFVPPWNRYDEAIGPILSATGIGAISAFGPARRLPSGTVECNCHIDIISWRSTRGFAGVEKTVRKLVEHLEARRTGGAPRREVSGLLTHHLAHDQGCWDFIAKLFQEVAGHRAARWVRPLEAVMAMEPS